MMKVPVIGGVAGGMSTAAKLKRNLGDKAAITVYEKGDTVSYAACGIPFFVGGVIKEESALIERTPAAFAERGITVKTRHEVTHVDTAKKTISGKNLENGKPFSDSYDKLVVASGARPRSIPPFDIEHDNLHVVRDVHDGVRLRRQLQSETVRDVVVVGGGFIGLEIAEACAKQGKNVSIVEFAERILSLMGPEITDKLAAELGKNHVQLRTGSKVMELVSENNHIESAIVESANGRETLPADLVVNCAGIVPDTCFIDVDKARNGAIAVDEHMETSAPDVFAAGDCSVMKSFVTGERQYAPLGTNANKQGRIIAEYLAGKKTPNFKLIGSSAIKLFSLDAAKVGLGEIEAQRLNLDYEANVVTGNSYASYYGTEKVMVKLVYDAKTRKLLGAQTVGQDIVVPRANYFAIAIAAEMTVDEFGFLDLCYSPPFSGVWDVSLIAANTAK